ncbi:MAG: lytic transglycosylase domain-containing protein [Patescibacteria group bacterium]
MLTATARLLASLAALLLILKMPLPTFEAQTKPQIVIQVITPSEERSIDRLDELVTEQIPVERARKTDKQFKNCLNYKSDFELAARLTNQPVELLIGLATIESGGCQNFGTGHAKGIMQIDLPGQRHVIAATRLLGLQAGKLDYQSNSKHNIVLGAVMLQDYTNRFGNVADGLEAYNQGPGNVEVGDHSDFPKYVVKVLAATRLSTN